MRIAISQRVMTINDNLETRDALSHDWFRLFHSLGGILYPVPNLPRQIQSFINHIVPDAIILSGGNHVLSKNEKLLEEPTKDVSYERDWIEQQLIQYSIKTATPLLGVCRGMQFINSFFGGSLSKAEGHAGTSHLIRVNPSYYYQSSRIWVNSYHHYGIKHNQLGNDLMPFAFCDKDQTVEGFFHNHYPISAIMWHPEREESVLGLSKKVLESLFK